MAEWIVFDIIMLFTLLIFAAIVIWAYKRETPMHFWSGTTVDAETITDVKKYNKANARMWLGYCVPMLASMVAAPFSVALAARIMSVGCVAGIPVLIFTYYKIKKKYTKGKHE